LNTISEWTNSFGEFISGIQLLGGCGTVSATGTIKVSPVVAFNTVVQRKLFGRVYSTFSFFTGTSPTGGE
jgi:hypothetical protein